MNLYNTQMDSGSNLYNTHMNLNPVSGKAWMNKADSGVTYASRKRLRDPINEIDSVYQKCKTSSDFASFVDQDAIYQSDIGRVIAQYTEKVRMEIDERCKRQTRMILQAIQDRVVKKLKEKDEEIERMGRMNWALQERVKSLFVENQIWRDLAQSNEAAANSLRNNLEEVLLARAGEYSGKAPAAAADDAESCCGSCEEGGGGVAGATVGGSDDVAAGKRWLCRKCGEKESSVLLLPCRHLCLCASCGSSLVGTCPVCDSVMNASLHVSIS